MKTRLVCHAAILLLAAAMPALAQENANPDPLAPVARYIEPQTVLAARIDFGKLRLEQSAKWISEVTASPELGEREQALIAKLTSVLKNHDGTHAFVIVALPDLLSRHRPSVLIPVDDPRQVLKELAAADLADDKVQVLNDCLFFGSDDVRQRLALNTPVKRPGLSAGAAAAVADGHEHFSVVGLPRDVRKVLAESLPDLPAEYGGAEGKRLAQAVQWAYVGMRLPPKPAIELRIKSENAEAAQALLKTIDALLPKANVQLAALLRFQRMDDKIVLRVDDENHQLAAILAMSGQLQLPASPHQRVNQLKQIGLAFHTYHDQYSKFPPFANGDAEGKPLLSWRVHLLPFLEQGPLYEKFRLDEPWDSPHNKKLVLEMPPVYGSPASEKVPAGHTVFQTPIMKGSLLGDDEVPRIVDILDGTSNTIMTIAVAPARAVIWTKPEDIKIDAQKPFDGVARGDNEEIFAGFCDGSVQIFTAKVLDAKSWLAMLTKNGAETIDWDKLNR